MIKRHSLVDEQLFRSILTIWTETGLANPARADDLATVQHTLDHGGCILVSYEAEIPTGTAWLTHDHRRLYIHHMGVLPEYQNRGIGRALLSEALQVAHELGYQAKLEVFETNEKALHLYYSFGFENLERYYTLIKRKV